MWTGCQADDWGCVVDDVDGNRCCCCCRIVVVGRLGCDVIAVGRDIAPVDAVVIAIRYWGVKKGSKKGSGLTLRQFQTKKMYECKT